MIIVVLGNERVSRLFARSSIVRVFCFLAEHGRRRGVDEHLLERPQRAVSRFFFVLREASADGKRETHRARRGDWRDVVLALARQTEHVLNRAAQRVPQLKRELLELLEGLQADPSSARAAAAAPVKEMLRRLGSPDPDWDDWTWVDV